MKRFLRQASSFIAPIFFCLVLPWLLVRAMHRSPVLNPSLLLVILGGVLCLAGLLVFVITVCQLIRIGQGTIMPWDPTRKLVVSGVYRHVRNPMISSVLAIILGEALLFGLLWLGLVGLLFFIINHFYFIFSEEPGLEKRFGEQYREYKKHVPRWIPRGTPWQPWK